MSEQSKPEPAVGQVRRGRLAYQERDALWVVASEGDMGAIVREDGTAHDCAITLSDLRSWPCVGVETPAGRVMVGERRGDRSGVTVLAVVDGGAVGIDGHCLRVRGDYATMHFQADVVASWPLVTTRPGCGCVTCECKAPSPVATKQARRREIDAIIADDAHRFPAFATARRAAVMAAFEGAPPVAPEDIVPVGHASNILRDCHRYEALRGGMTKPSTSAVEWAALAGGSFAIALAAYERMRGAQVSSREGPVATDPAARARAIRSTFPPREQTLAEAYGVPR